MRTAATSYCHEDANTVPFDPEHKVSERKRNQTSCDGALPRSDRGNDRYAAIGDGELLAAYRTKGDERAFNTLVSRYEKELACYGIKLTKNHAIAHDLVQETFLRLIRSATVKLDQPNLKAYLYRTLTNINYDRLRSLARQPTYPLGGDAAYPDSELPLVQDKKALNPLDELIRSEEIDHVRAGIRELAEHHREALQSIAINGDNYQGYANEAQIQIGTVKSRVHAAKASLASVLIKSGAA